VPFNPLTYVAGVSQVDATNLNEINNRLKNQWRSIGLGQFDHVAGAAPSVTNGVLSLPATSQVQYYLDQYEFTQITKIRVRHADGATPLGQLRVQPAESNTAGAVSVVTINVLQAPTDFASSTNFASDDDTLASPYLGADDKALFISLTNIGTETVVVHKVMVFSD
jgi:hypothetical protein